MEYIIILKFMEGLEEHYYYYDTYEETIEKVKEFLQHADIFSVKIEKR